MSDQIETSTVYGNIDDETQWHFGYRHFGNSDDTTSQRTSSLCDVECSQSIHTKTTHQFDGVYGSVSHSLVDDLVGQIGVSAVRDQSKSSQSVDYFCVGTANCTPVTPTVLTSTNSSTIKATPFVVVVFAPVALRYDFGDVKSVSFEFIYRF